MGGKFSESKRNLDLVPPGQRDIPGPCSYQPDHKVLLASRAVSMGNTKRKFETDDLIYMAKDMPGPGDYDVRRPFAPDVDWEAAERAKNRPLPKAAHDTRLPDNRCNFPTLISFLASFSALLFLMFFTPTRNSNFWWNLGMCPVPGATQFLV